MFQLTIKLYIVDVWDGHVWRVATVKGEPSVHLVYGNAVNHQRTIDAALEALPDHETRVRTLAVTVEPTDSGE